MSSFTPSSSVTASPFTQAAFNAVRRLYPEELADKSFDNTGILLEAPYKPAETPSHRLRNSVLLAIDLTTAVADEAIQRRHSIIVAYHPIIFRGLKSLRLANSQQKSLLRLAAEGISVYCPHTSVDAARGGNGDWLSDVVTGHFVLDTARGADKSVGGFATSLSRSSSYCVHQYSSPTESHRTSGLAHTRRVIQPNKDEKDVGFGRIVALDEPAPLAALLGNIAAGVGQPKAIAVALPQDSKVEDIFIRTIGVCAGSGASLLSGQDVDLLLTGELDHHSALAAIEEGRVVVALNHSNSERGFLTGVMQPALAKELKEVWKEDSEVVVSVADKDPFSFAIQV